LSSFLFRSSFSDGVQIFVFSRPGGICQSLLKVVVYFSTYYY